jgi:hypothetical protein
MASRAELRDSRHHHSAGHPRKCLDLALGRSNLIAGDDKTIRLHFLLDKLNIIAGEDSVRAGSTTDSSGTRPRRARISARWRLQIVDACGRHVTPVGLGSCPHNLRPVFHKIC